MLLLVTWSRSASTYSALLQRGCAERVENLSNLTAAISALGQRHYSGIVVDQDLATADPAENARLLNACGTVSVVYLDLANSAPEQIIQKVTSALGTHNEHLAVRVAASTLRNQLRNSVTGILLSSELAMAVPELPRAAQVKIKFVHDLAKGISRQLEA